MGLNFCWIKLSWFLRIKKPSTNILNCEYLEQGVVQLHKMDTKRCQQSPLCSIVAFALCIGDNMDNALLNIMEFQDHLAVDP